MKKIILLFTLMFNCESSFAFFDGGAGFAQIAKLIQIIEQNRERFKQLRDIQRFERLIHEGRIDVYGLAELLPIDSETIFYLRQFEQNYKKIQDFYGDISNNPNKDIHRINDEIIAESLTLQGSLAKYTKRQEKNATQLLKQARGLSPRGAAQATVISNAQILHAINQLIKINGQLLKLQGQKMALENKNEKDEARNFYNDIRVLKKGFNNYNSDTKLVGF